MEFTIPAIEKDDTTIYSPDNLVIYTESTFSPVFTRSRITEATTDIGLLFSNNIFEFKYITQD